MTYGNQVFSLRTQVFLYHLELFSHKLASIGQKVTFNKFEIQIQTAVLYCTYCK